MYIHIYIHIDKQNHAVHGFVYVYVYAYAFAHAHAYNVSLHAKNGSVNCQLKLSAKHVYTCI